ncbi:LysR substrate-binding domain-containing protein [Caballeronia sp. LZ001]|uniref:LysR substrate-binding domain-containing protein n=1 Tax=Caballeronia sp. LZ001 TaxID=3038553 RepID=UPI002855B1DF|nr:LysR substrate-binding domain-containing protein [Caballeronia sp. LZ001]MDR5806579.1 LysR substrate-binding domain-containing protein [Caballeronia sp. LZ001]
MQYADIRIEIPATHVPLDLYSENMDVALRFGALPDSSLMAQKLGSFSTTTYASPAYIGTHGAPESPDDLCLRPTLVLHQARTVSGLIWTLSSKGRKARSFALRPPSWRAIRFCFWTLLSLAMEFCLQWIMAPEVATGRLCKVLPDWSGPPQHLHALSPGARAPSPKLRGFLRYLKAHLRFPPST